MKRILVVVGASIAAVLVAFAALVIGVSLIASVQKDILDTQKGPQFTFVLDASPEFLTDQLAFAKSCEAMEQAGFDVNVWLPQKDGRTTDPSGDTDVYLARNSLNPNAGYIHFIAASNKGERLILLELSEDELSCQLWTPK